MKKNLYFVKLFCCIVMVFILLSPDTQAQQIICGEALLSVLQNVCTNGFYPKLINPKYIDMKRSVVLPNYGLESEFNSDILPLPYAGSSSSMGNMYSDIANLMAKTRRRRKYAADECCNKGCTYDDIQTFCM